MDKEKFMSAYRIIGIEGIISTYDEIDVELSIWEFAELFKTEVSPSDHEEYYRILKPTLDRLCGEIYKNVWICNEYSVVEEYSFCSEKCYKAIITEIKQTASEISDKGYFVYVLEDDSNEEIEDERTETLCFNCGLFLGLENGCEEELNNVVGLLDHAYIKKQSPLHDCSHCN